MTLLRIPRYVWLPRDRRDEGLECSELQEMVLETDTILAIYPDRFAAERQPIDEMHDRPQVTRWHDCLRIRTSIPEPRSYPSGTTSPTTDYFVPGTIIGLMNVIGAERTKDGDGYFGYQDKVQIYPPYPDCPVEHCSQLIPHTHNMEEE